MPQFLDTTTADFETRFAALLGMKREDSPDVDAIVADIIADVRARGDAAVRDLAQKFDGYTPPSFRLTASEIEAAIQKVSTRDMEDIRFAQDQIRRLLFNF